MKLYHDKENNDLFYTIPGHTGCLFVGTERRQLDLTLNGLQMYTVENENCWYLFDKHNNEMSFGEEPETHCG